MKLMPCPLHGERNIAEFVCRGPVISMPSVKASKENWARYLFLAENKAGIVDEWWLHTASGMWFVARRDTISDEILQTWTIEAYRKQRGKIKLSKTKRGETKR